jgi:hypothetical protein
LYYGGMARRMPLRGDLSVDVLEVRYRATGLCLERLRERIDAPRAAEQWTQTEAEREEARRR